MELSVLIIRLQQRIYSLALQERDFFSDWSINSFVMVENIFSHAFDRKFGLN